MISDDIGVLINSSIFSDGLVYSTPISNKTFLNAFIIGALVSADLIKSYPL
jgi:hypothetical protein